MFPFGSVVAFCCVCDGNHYCTNFESRCLLGVVVGPSKFKNGMVVHNPTLDRFCIFADYLDHKA